MIRRTAILSIAAWVGFAGLLRLTVLPPEQCPPLDATAARQSAEAAVRWIMWAQQPDGSYVYEYDSRTKTESPQYNEVRHAGVTLTLFQAEGRLDGDGRALAAGDRGLDWMTAHLLRREGWAALLNPGGDRPSLGATALMTVGLAERRLATGDGRHDALMRELGEFMASLQRPDGGFYVAYDPSAGRPVDGTSRYYPGEALWALVLLHRAFPGARGGTDRRGRPPTSWRRDAMRWRMSPSLRWRTSGQPTDSRRWRRRG